jgi:hypothetical protein
MACSCGKNRLTNANKTWVHTDTSGKKTTYSSEMDARMAASRKGGTVKAG